jgi:CheY-like chemotaxis protein
LPGILVEDDEEPIRKPRCKIFERLGHDVRFASDAEAAIAMSRVTRLEVFEEENPNRASHRVGHPSLSGAAC